MTPFAPQFDYMKFDFDKDPQRVDETAALQDATWTELSTFTSRGGKMILYHGLGDPYFSPNDTVRYYEKLLADNGGPAATSSARMFLILACRIAVAVPVSTISTLWAPSWPG